MTQPTDTSPARDPSPERVSQNENRGPSPSEGMDRGQNDGSENVQSQDLLPAGSVQLDALAYGGSTESHLAGLRQMAGTFVPMRVLRRDAAGVQPPRQTSIDPALTCVMGNQSRAIPDSDRRHQAIEFYKFKTTQLDPSVVTAVTATFSNLVDRAKPGSTILIAITDENREFTRENAVIFNLDATSLEISEGSLWSDPGALEKYPAKLGERLITQIFSESGNQSLNVLERWRDYFESVPLGRLPYIKILFIGDSFSCAHTTLDVHTAHTLMIVFTGAQFDLLVKAARIIAARAPALQCVIISGGHNDFLRVTTKHVGGKHGLR